MELLKNLWDKNFQSTFFLQFTPQEKKFKLLEAKILQDTIKPLKWISYQFLFKQVLIKMLFLLDRFLNDNKKWKSPVKSLSRQINENSSKDQNQVPTSFKMRIKSQFSEFKTKLLNCKIQTCCNYCNKSVETFNKTLVIPTSCLQTQST